MSAPAGLLTYSCRLRLPSFEVATAGTSIEFTASGNVLDLHQFPYYTSERYRSETKVVI